MIAHGGRPLAAPRGVSAPHSHQAGPRPARWLWRAVALCGALMVALSPARADTTTDQLRSAVRLARAAAWDDAVAALPPGPALNRSHRAMLYDAARALRDERPGEAARLYAAIRRLDPDDTPARIALETLFARTPAPDGLDPADLWLLPLTSQSSPVPPCAGCPDAAVVVTVPKPFLDTAPATEPRTGLAYPRTAGVYVTSGGRLRLRLVVHAMPSTDEGRMVWIGRFLGLLSQLTPRLWERPDAVAWPVHVWLSPAGAPGAEQWGGGIRVNGVDTERGPLEWGRQLAHEWGHLTIPGVEGFRAPETWANGNLGERLFLPWLARWGAANIWGGAVDVDAYTRKYVHPPREAFARTGPVPALVNDGSQRGFDHFLGAALYVANAYGAPVLMDALNDMDAPRAPEFLAALRRVLAKRLVHTVRRDAGQAGARAVCIPVAGRYMLEWLVAGGGVRKSGPTSYRAGWVMMEWSGDLTVRRLPAEEGSKR